MTFQSIVAKIVRMFGKGKSRRKTPKSRRPEGRSLLQLHRERRKDLHSCFKRLAVGRSLIDRYVKRELRCDSLRACEEACALESAFVCEGFNFKFDRVGFESKCQLTNIPSAKLSLTSDFNADADFDFFEKDRNAPRKCHFPWHVYRPPWGGGEPPNRPWGRPDYAFGHGYGGHPNGIPDSYDAPNFDRGPPPNLDRGPPPNQDRGPPPNFDPPYGRPPPPDQPDFNPNQISPPRWPPDRFADKGFDFGGGQHAWLGNGFGLPDDCFERVKTGLKLKDAMIKFSIKVSSLSECEAACINMPYFTCRAFSFRYGPPTIGDREDNCLLTDWTTSDGNMNINKDFAIDPECELYYRGSYGHGCEIGRYPEYSPIGGFERPRPPPPSGGYRPGGYLPPDGPGDNFIPSRPGYYPPDKPDIIPPKPGPAYLPTPDDGYQRPPPREPGSNAYLPPPPRPDGDGFPIKPPGGNAYLPPADRPNGYLPPDKPGNGQLPPPRPGPAYLPIPPEKPDRAYLPSRGRYPPDYSVLYQVEHPSSTASGSGKSGDVVPVRISMQRRVHQSEREDEIQMRYDQLQKLTYLTVNHNPVFRCYVGSADRDQWRPCSDSYYPYAHSGKKLHWPVAYLHREGPPNVTLDHKPSIVDRFLNSLDKLAGGGRGNGTMETVTLPAEPRKESDSDKESAMDKLWMWGKAQFNNLTSSAEPPSTDSSPSSTILSTAASTTDSPTTTAAPTTTLPVL
ncbi:unnamed protein product [Nesidiocoris tenuis]|uniref:Apple domain-containing protein n=1 Tax=Nesidiocoris tenuis TaxID=355587 RepID=A0A6H5H1R5_9HEMI|nr:unnamed protein product [Nesidiocoris tenuis]